MQENIYVWTTFINNKDYLDGAHVLAYSLEVVKSKYKLIIFYPHDFDLQKNNKLTNIIYTPIKQLVYMSHLHARKNYSYCINKIYSWTLTTYAKVCWIDSDMIFLQNSDAIFDYIIEEDEIAAASGCTCNTFNNKTLPTLCSTCPFNNINNTNTNTHTNTTSNNIYINAGLILLKPNINIYNSLLTENYTYPLVEQDAFNIIFKNKIKVLDSKYNYINNLEFAHASYVCNIHIFHFAYGKPWDDVDKTGNISHTYDDIYTLWKKYKKMIDI